jgi:hypothetical protein
MAQRDPATALRLTAASWNVRARVGGEIPPLFRVRLLERVRATCEAALGDRDPSVPIGLAAIVRAAGPTDSIAFSDLVHGYREAYLACYQPLGDADHEVSGDEVRHHLNDSVLPRLATEGWILDTAPGYWQTVRPRVAWWGPTPEERQAVYDALLGSARRAVQRAKSYTKKRAKASLRPVDCGARGFASIRASEGSSTDGNPGSIGF